MTTTRKKIVLAYSGGLDTSVAVPWLRENYDADVITCTIDLGMVDLEAIRQRAFAVGASDAVTVDGRETLVDEFLWPALRAGAIYEGQYPLATALGRPLIARYLAEVAREHEADAVAHGCTGKGNDQVRIEVGVSALAPGVELIAPIREWGMNREDEVLTPGTGTCRSLRRITNTAPTKTCGAGAPRPANWRTRGLSRPKTPMNGPSVRGPRLMNLPTLKSVLRRAYRRRWTVRRWLGWP